MKFLSPLALAPLAFATVLAAPSAFASTHLTGDLAASIIDALTHAEVTTSAAGPAHMQLRADRISCVTSSATGGQPACIVEADGVKHDVSMDDAYGTWIALNKTNQARGGAHAGEVTIEATKVVCDIYLEQLGDNGRMPNFMCDL